MSTPIQWLVAGPLLAFVGRLCAAESLGPLDRLVGQPADASGSAHQYRADRKADENPPESWIGLMQYAELPFDKKSDLNAPGIKKVLCSLLWEEVRQVRKVELAWPADATNRPSRYEVKLVGCDGDDGRAHHW